MQSSMSCARAAFQTRQKTRRCPVWVWGEGRGIRGLLMRGDRIGPGSLLPPLVLRSLECAHIAGCERVGPLVSCDESTSRYF